MNPEALNCGDMLLGMVLEHRSVESESKWNLGHR
jgi:hypothetical protein